MSDSVQKLMKQAVKKPEKTVDLLDATAGYVSPEAQAKMEKRPKFSEGFIEQQAKRFGKSVDEVREVAEAVEKNGEPALVLERRQFAVEDDVRAEFQKLYNSEIARKRVCPRVRPNGDKCGVELESIQQALTHHSLHLLYEADPRTQNMMWKQIRELLYPVEEKSVRAALGPEERRRWLQDERLRNRLAR